MFELRFCQVGDLHYILLHPADLLWVTNPHNARFVPYSTVLHKATYSVLTIPKSDS
jgi:hypothetical protein